MKLGVFTVLYGNLTFEETLKKLSEQGVQAVEVGAGGYPGDAHLKPKELLNNPDKIQAVLDTAAKYSIEIAAISCHGNPVHPQKEIAEKFHNAFIEAVLLAEQMGIGTVVGFSGCPGDSLTSQYPNWVTCPWPEDFMKVLDYQWNEVLIPYWKEMAAFAKSHSVNRIALEMHPGFCVYNPATLLRLREACGDVIGANFDPSHLFWQGMDPAKAAVELKEAIYHVHAKDTKINPYNTATNGVLDIKHYSQTLERSWQFRTVGYGHGAEVWNEIISTLKSVGYDGIISIEHEDALMSQEEGLSKAIEFLKQVIVFEPVQGMWWA